MSGGLDRLDQREAIFRWLSWPRAQRAAESKPHARAGVVSTGSASVGALDLSAG